jgi:hypothetical protein
LIDLKKGSEMMFQHLKKSVSAGLLSAVVVVLLSFVSYAEADAALIGHWNFDEGSGQTAADSSGSGNDGTLGITAGVEDQDPTWESVSCGYALTFDGSDDEVDLSSVPIGNRSAWTFTAWIKTSSTAKMTIYSEGNSGSDKYVYIDKKSDGKVEYYLRNDPNHPIFSGSTVVHDDAWHLVTIVQRSPTDRELYVDGKSEGTNTVNSGTVSHDVATIGTLNYQYGPTDYFAGTIDDVRIYDHALSLAEISALTASPPTDCAADWMATGSFTGNGTSQSITGLGFQPEVVIIKGDLAATNGVIRSTTMSGTKDIWATTAPEANLITSLDSDGFSVGGDSRVNGSSSTYYWTAFNANADMVVGTYTGDGSVSTDTQAISGLGFSPEYLIVISNGANWARNRTSYGTNNSMRMRNSGVNTDTIPSLDADGFTVQVGTDSQEDMNASGVSYNYIAFNQLAGKIKVGEYTGNGSDNRDITGVGFQPEYVLLQTYNGGDQVIQRSDQMVGDNSIDFYGALVANRIQSLISDGFQVGNDARVNQSDTPDEMYAYVAFNITGAGSTANLYRSVGTDGSELIDDADCTVGISGSTATFNSDAACVMPDNIGVGDVLVYNNGSNQLAFIHGRTSAKVFTVKDKDGGTPATATAGTSVGVYRAYTLLSNWESQTQNTNITEPSPGDVNPSMDLVTANTIMMVACYNDNDTAMDDELDIAGWTTGASNYIRIFTPTDTSEVGTSQRHTGAAGTGFRIAQTKDLTSDNYHYAIRIRASANYTRIEGIEIDGSGWTNGGKVYGIVVDGSISNPADIRYSHNIVHDIKNSTVHDATAADAFGLECGPGDCRISNNIVYDIGNLSALTDAEARGIVVTDNNSWVYNNTVYKITNSGGTDYARGIFRDSGTATVTNNAVFDVDNTGNTSEACFSGSMTADYNISSDDTADDNGGTGNIINKTDYSSYFQNTTDGTENLHLKGDSNSLWGSYGADLDADANLPITDDIDGDSRDASQPDIGADEYVAGANSAPTAPTTPYLNNTTAQGGQATPATGITDPTPAFSAVYADPDSGDIANKYRIEVNTNATFTGTEMWDSGASGTAMADTTAGNRSPDIIYSGSALADSTTYYWRITFWDDDGEEGAVSATQQFTTGTISPTAIYYSVGTSTDDLKSGTPTMTIASRTATFSAAQPDNIGVGDVITYNTSLKVYISGRTSSTVYTVQTVTGGAPADVTDATVNSIKRTFNSLNNAALNSDEPSYLNTADLVTGKYQLNWPCYGDGEDTDSVTITGWTTGPDNYIKIFTPVSSSMSV